MRLEPDRIFIRDGAIWTSAGITAGIDLALALIAEDLGEEIARQTAQQLVVYRRRPGGQSQFSALLEMERPGRALRFADRLGARTPGRAARCRAPGGAGGDEPAQFRPPLPRRDRAHAGPRDRAASRRMRSRKDRGFPEPIDRIAVAAASATPSACAARFCARSANRRRRFGGRRGGKARWVSFYERPFALREDFSRFAPDWKAIFPSSPAKGRRLPCATASEDMSPLATTVRRRSR